MQCVPIKLIQKKSHLSRGNDYKKLSLLITFLSRPCSLNNLGFATEKFDYRIQRNY